MKLFENPAILILLILIVVCYIVGFIIALSKRSKKYLKTNLNEPYNKKEIKKRRIFVSCLLSLPFAIAFVVHCIFFIAYRDALYLIVSFFELLTILLTFCGINEMLDYKQKYIDLIKKCQV